MSDALRLVAEVNAYLDQVDLEAKPGRARIPQLEQYKADMLARGFGAPFLAMVAQARAEMDEEAAEDLSDRSKQIKRLRYVASLKKFTLNRMRVALAAHKLAQALEESGQGGQVAFLPFGGSYVKQLANAGEMAAEGYHALMSLFMPRRFSLSSASAVIKAAAGDRTQERALDLGEEENPAQALKELLGNAKNVKELTIAKPKGLIKNHSTRVALFTMAACAAQAQARGQMEAAQDGRLREYNALLHKHGIVPDVEIAHLHESMPRLVQEALEAGFVSRSKGGDFFMEEELETALYKRRVQHRRLCTEGARAIIYRLLMWYYVCLHADGRNAYGAMPSVRAEPDEEQLRVMRELKPEEEEAPKHPDRLLAQKLEFEARAPPLPPAVWGPAFVALKSGQGAAWAAREFSGDERAIADAMPLLKGLVEQPQGRGAKFLEGLKKE